MSYKADFHIHTDFSDGALTPTEVVKRFKGLEYDMIAITDHDGVDGVREAMIAAEALDFKVIPGIELATSIDKKFVNECGISLEKTSESSYSEKEAIEAHLLGYYIDTENEALTEKLKEIRQRRHDRNLKLIELLQKQGYDVSYDDLISNRRKDYIGKPVIARLLVSKGYIQNPAEAFAKDGFFENPEAKAIKKEKVSIFEGMELIEGAGGISVFAHPMKLKNIGERGSKEFFENLEKLVRGLKKRGLKGIECYHKDHSAEDALKLVALAEKYHLHITEGSDFHGDDF